MTSRRAAGTREQKVVMTLPDMNLKPAEINSLKKRFKNEVVTSLGGAEALARRRIVIIIVVIIVGPSEW